jgi:hypothetical protein
MSLISPSTATALRAGVGRIGRHATTANRLGLP